MSTRTFTRVLIALACITVLALFARHADAQTQPQVQAQAALSWTMPTTDTLGNPLTGANALQRVWVFASTSPITEANLGAPAADLPGTATSYQYTATVPNGSTLHFRLKACNAQCSALSNQATKQVAVSIPNVPTGVSVTVTVTIVTN